MKKTHKAFVLSAVMMAFVALVLTGCNFGKDDFYGTWQSGVFARPSDGANIRVTFYFSGKSENLTSGGSAYFYEIYENLDNDLNTFWWGTYSLGNNSDVTNGTLTLRYMYGVGYNDKGVEYHTVDELITASNKKKVADGASAFETLLNSSKATRKFDQYDTTNKACSDVEKFDFKLDGAVAFQGYTQMLCTAKCQWCEDKVDATQVSHSADGTKKSPAEGTSWGAAGVSRSFSLTNDNGDAYGETLELDSSSSIFAGSVPSLQTTASFAVPLPTPEK